MQDAFHLRLVGIDLWRRRAGVSRRFGSVAALKALRPMNLYGWSKHLFDMAVAERAALEASKLPPQWAGLKFFNVFGPNEYHKGTMMSVLARRFDDIKAGRPVQLFKSHRDGIADGDQRRDFIYVDDVVRVMMWLLATPDRSAGICNVGTGKARSFRDHDAGGLCRARQAKPNIQYIDMPEQIRGTLISISRRATVDRLQRAGYNGGFTALEDAVACLRQDLSRFAPIASADGATDDENRCSILMPCRVAITSQHRALCRRSHAR